VDHQLTTLARQDMKRAENARKSDEMQRKNQKREEKVRARPPSAVAQGAHITRAAGCAQEMQRLLEMANAARNKAQQASTPSASGTPAVTPTPATPASAPPTSAEAAG
jgi:hypothetical protein